MIKAVQIQDIKEVSRIVRETLITDDLLFARYHLFNHDVEKAISDTIEKIRVCLTLPDSKFWVIMKDDREIGYFSGVLLKDEDMSPKSLLHSFGMQVTYRNKENISGMFDLVKQELQSNCITCLLYDKNNRAIKSCTLSGFIVDGRGTLPETNIPFTVLKYTPCPSPQS
jgi:hypothetical protein